MTDHGTSKPTSRPDAGACPDENLLVAFVEQRLLDAKRAPVEDHLVRCPRCLELVSEIARPDLDPETVAAAPRRAPVRWVLLAASLLIAVSVAVIAIAVRSGPPSSSKAERLEAALRSGAETLARALPERFSAFTPLTREERLKPRTAIERSSGIVLIRPVKNILTTRPTFTWEAAGDARPAQIVLHRVQGVTRIAFEPWVLPDSAATDRRLTFPPGNKELGPGKYQWRIRFESSFGRFVSPPRSFRIVSIAERKDFRLAAEAIAQRAEPRIRDLLKAHFAIRRGLYAQAETAVRGHLRSYPDDRPALESLYHVLATIGSAEAATVLPAPEDPDKD